MFLKVNPADEIPIYEQIVRQVKFAVASKSLVQGELIPSVRELAKQLAVNPNTVVRAYRQLQDEGLIASRRGTGMIVTDRAQDICHTLRVEMIRDRLRQVLAEAEQSGLDQQAIRKLVEAEISKLKKH
ncbi:MAG: GntR family transcriptional regulator [Planctomycetia bacterium]|jgi:GntR family transcriptional regulator